MSNESGPPASELSTLRQIKGILGEIRDHVKTLADAERERLEITERVERAMLGARERLNAELVESRDSGVGDRPC